MVRIADLSEDYSLDVEALARGGVRTVDDLWACISRRVDEGVSTVAGKTNINRSVLLAFLISDALDDPRRSYKPKPKENLFWLIPKWLGAQAQRLWGTRRTRWPDLLLVALPLLIIGLGLRGQSLNRSVVQRVAVDSGVTLPAFACIDTGKLTTRAVLNEPGSFATVDELKERYPLRDLAPGELVKDEHLVPVGLSKSLAQRRLLSLPIKNSSSIESAQPMDRVKLIFAPRDKDQSGVVIDDVIFLSAKKEGDATFARVAISELEVSRIEGLLGTCDLFISQTLD